MMVCKIRWLVLEKDVKKKKKKKGLARLKRAFQGGSKKKL
jgi:hypothetical protein